MRRALSIFVLLALALPLALPALASPPVGPHACCRRGAHMCHSTAPSDAPAVSGIARCCRCYQSSPPPPCEPEATVVPVGHAAAAPADIEFAVTIVSRRVLASSGRAPPASLS
ncbi:MAG TPA: hypothetical protein VFU76_05310 [Terriglobales bacterium]|nr:hypothetical protein [Terriglobales bacterium]